MACVLWLRRGIQGDAEALDFAVTSGLRADRYRDCIDNPGTIFAEYEAYKRSYKFTGDLCRQENLRFTPMILEAHGGGWSPTFRRIVDWISKSEALANHEDQSTTSLQTAQRISCSLQRETARAILRRQVTQDSCELVQSAWTGMGHEL